MNSLTVKEWVELRTTLLAIDNREFQCAPCLQKYAGRVDAEKMTAASREVKGCVKPRSRPVHVVQNEEKTEVISYSLCPGNFWSQDALSMIQMHGHFRRGFLPFPGSVADQPAKVMEVFSVIDLYMQEKAEVERKRQQQKNERLLKGARRGIG